MDSVIDHGRHKAAGAQAVRAAAGGQPRVAGQPGAALLPRLLGTVSYQIASDYVYDSIEFGSTKERSVSG